MKILNEKQYHDTIQIIEQLEPMISFLDYDKFRNNPYSPKLDIKVLQEDGEKTIWGKEDMSDHYVTDDLTEAGLEFMDWMQDGYEIWIKKQPIVVGEPSPSFTKPELNFVISWLVGEFQEGADFGASNSPIVQIRKVGEYYVLVGVWDDNYFHREYYWTRFGVPPEYRGPGTNPNLENHPIEDAIFDAVIMIRNETSEQLKEDQIKLTEEIVQSGKFPCEHCQEMSDKIDPDLYRKFLGGIEKDNNELRKYSEKLKTLIEYEEKENFQQHLSKKDLDEWNKYKENLIKLKDNCKKIVNLSYEQLHKLEQEWAPVALAMIFDDQSDGNKTYDKKFYRCGRCKTIFCSNRFVGRSEQKLCFKCNDDIINNTPRKLWSRSCDVVENSFEGYVPFWFKENDD